MEIPPFSILYEDEQLVVINKPTKLLVHRTKISEDTVFALQLLRQQIKQRVYPIHRLDRATSGALIFGKSSAAAAFMAQQFQQKKVEKKYLGIIRGFVEVEGCINYPLARETHLPKKAAISHYQRLAQCEMPYAIGRYATARYSLVSIRPETGRRHQIRRHFAHLRHPLIGDKKHGDVKHNKFWHQELGVSRLLLHAQELEFPLFEQSKTIRVEAPLDEPYQKAMNILGFTTEEE